MFQFFKKSRATNHMDINEVPDRMSNDSSIRLFDVRTPQEYKSGHLPQSTSLPLPRVTEMETLVPEKSTPIVLYCQSGARSRQAAGVLERMGYTNITNAGGIAQWQGELQQ